MKNAGTLKTLRMVSQGLFFALFVYVFVRSLNPFSPGENPFLRFDPLILLTHLRFEPRYVLPIAGILLLTLVVGRYFCGWVCPLGSLTDVLDAALTPLRRMNPLDGWRKGFGRRFRHAPPSWFILGASVVAIFFTPPVLQFFHPHVWIVRVFSLSGLGIAFAGMLVIMAGFTRRFWCAYLCPIGAFYGILGKISLMRLSIAKCSKCRRCESCPTDAAEFEQQRVVDHQCILCFDFEEKCPVKGFRFGLRSEVRTADSPVVPVHLSAPAQSAVGGEGPLDPRAVSRRRFLTEGLARGALAVGGLAFGSVLSVFDRTVKTPLLRPPGVENETAFVKRCVRCFQCVRSCPNRIIKISGLEGGFDSLFTPHLEFNELACDYHCQVCQQVCPNYAIPLQTLEEKQRSVIGLARIDEIRCVVFARDTNCLVCEEFCPVPEKAIKVVEKTKLLRGGPMVLRYPVIDSTLCNGCGKCEGNCPVEGKAIFVEKA